MRMFKLTACVAMALPLLTFAATSARQEYSTAIASKPDAVHGEQLFAGCVACHGADASGVLAQAAPRIAGQHYRVLLRQLIDFRHGRRWDMRMEGVAKNHEMLPQAQDIADVAWFVSLMDRDGTRRVGDGLYIARGEQLYAARCVACHGVDGAGDAAKEIPRIAGQHASYLAAQIYDAVDGRRVPLTQTHRRRFANLVFEDVQGLTDFIARMGWASEPVPVEASAKDDPGSAR